MMDFRFSHAETLNVNWSRCKHVEWICSSAPCETHPVVTCAPGGSAGRRSSLRPASPQNRSDRPLWREGTCRERMGGVRRDTEENKRKRGSARIVQICSVNPSGSFKGQFLCINAPLSASNIATKPHQNCSYRILPAATVVCECHQVNSSILLLGVKTVQDTFTIFTGV